MANNCNTSILCCRFCFIEAIVPRWQFHLSLNNLFSSLVRRMSHFNKTITSHFPHFLMSRGFVVLFILFNVWNSSILCVYGAREVAHSNGFPIIFEMLNMQFGICLKTPTHSRFFSAIKWCQINNFNCLGDKNAVRAQPASTSAPCPNYQVCDQIWINRKSDWVRY